MAVGFTVAFMNRCASSACLAQAENASLPANFPAMVMGHLVKMTSELANNSGLELTGNEQTANLSLPNLANSGIELS